MAREPGWYWLRMIPGGPWRPFQWYHSRDGEAFWAGTNWGSEPSEVGPRIDPPDAPSPVGGADAPKCPRGGICPYGGGCTDCWGYACESVAAPAPTAGKTEWLIDPPGGSGWSKGIFDNRAEAEEYAAACPPHTRIVGAREAQLPPGWLARDVRRCVERVNEWEGKAPTAGDMEWAKTTIQEALRVGAFHHGVTVGWNLGVAEDNDGLARAQAYTGHLAGIKRARQILADAASAPTAGDIGKRDRSLSHAFVRKWEKPSDFSVDVGGSVLDAADLGDRNSGELGAAHVEPTAGDAPETLETWAAGLSLAEVAEIEIKAFLRGREFEARYGSFGGAPTASDAVCTAPGCDPQTCMAPDCLKVPTAGDAVERDYSHWLRPAREVWERLVRDDMAYAEMHIASTIGREVEADRRALIEKIREPSEELVKRVCVERCVREQRRHRKRLEDPLRSPYEETAPGCELWMRWKDEVLGDLSALAAHLLGDQPK